MVFGLFSSTPAEPAPVVEAPKDEKRKSNDSNKGGGEKRKSGDTAGGSNHGKLDAPGAPHKVLSRHGGFGLHHSPTRLNHHSNHPISIHQHHSSISDHGYGSESNSRTDGLLPILLYEAQHSNTKQLPNSLKHYRYVAYVVYFLIALYSWGYLGFIGYFQAHPRMQIQYIAVVKFLEFNSYSLLSPLLCSVFMALLMYQVNKRVNLNEGDFFGLLGLLLLFSLINLHDGYGVLRLVRFTEKDYNKTSQIHLDPPKRNTLSRNNLHWQYAWSTRPSCAQKYVRDMIYQHEQDMRHFKKQILVAPETTMHARQAHQVATANLGMAKLKCKEWHDDINKAHTRFWMRDLQSEFKCCGPYGYNLWKEWFASPDLTGCDSDWINPVTNDIPDCFDSLMKWFHDIFETMYVIMFIQSGLWIIAMVFASIHFAAMKYEQAAPEKQFSLLNMTDLEAANRKEDLAWARQSNHVVEGGDNELKDTDGQSSHHKHKHAHGKKHMK